MFSRRTQLKTIGATCASLVLNAATGQVPNDPLHSNQYALTKIKAHQAWAITTGGETVQGDEIVVAVLDDGFDLLHPDLLYWTNAEEIPNNGIDDDDNGYVDDYSGWNAIDGNGNIPNGTHGTRVAGIIGAIGNNGLGIAGINWNIRILPVVVASSTPASVISGYEYVKALRQRYNSTGGSSGAFVVATNLSQSLINAVPSDYPAWCSVYDALGYEGILNVNGPKNWHREIGVSSGFPSTPFNDLPALCGSEFLIVVTNTDSNDELVDLGGATGAPWSSAHVDLAAPGHLVLSTESGGTYDDEQSGTSFAAPAVAGAVALMFSAACDNFIQEYKSNPSASILYIKEKLLNNTDPIGGLVSLIGHGRLNIHRALTAISEAKQEYILLTGATTDSDAHEAIIAVESEEYQHDFPGPVLCKAGSYIELMPSTRVIASDLGYFEAVIDPVSFECAIPIQPLNVSLVAPPTAACDSWVTCNAAAYGGLPPYSFTWETRLTSSTNWHTHPQTSYLLVLSAYYNDNFYVRVKVSDAIGTFTWSETNLVVCIDGMIIQETANNHMAISASTKVMNPSAAELLKGSDLLRVVPNPTNQGGARIVFVSKTRCVSGYAVHDNSKRLVFPHKQYSPPECLEGNEFEITLDLSGLSPGSYWLTLQLDDDTSLSEQIIVIQ